ncbi:CRAL-TRIO domain-containing protein [Polychytrium aggregatum]|uniref:CRAL-TRIO domain-containing protein n=1 Tax=Polychytrium aggregatum TaxID=110093 RepID=UPI0022FEF3D2|nr:CRAL-TRIO domain-containing protein [Polychytrium aggregatum]KAI9202940.1 CRAL-TRIO domain-containing protein [Polychytrium aggregatum]
MSITTVDTAKLQELISRVRSSPDLEALDSSQLSDWWIRKYYISAGGNLDVALKAIENTLIWRREFRYQDIWHENFAEEVQSRKLCFQGKARDGSAILYWKGSRHVADVKKADHRIRFIVRTIEQAIRDGILDDRLTIVVDKSDVGSENLDGMQFYRMLIRVLQDKFPQILQRVIVFPTNWILWTTWKVIKSFLDPSVADKFIMLGPKEMHEGLLRYLSPEVVPVRYGGTLTDQQCDEYFVRENGMAQQPAGFRSNPCLSTVDDSSTMDSAVSI